MENTFYQSLIAELSDSDRQIFEELLARVEALDGNLQQLSADDQAKLSELVAKHNSSLAEQASETETLSAAETPEQINVSVADITEIPNPATSEFGAFLLANIDEHLCQGGASTADAIRYAFHNRWMPEKLKNRDICEDLYYRYIDDIEKANEKIQKHSASHASNDAVVAVGLTWFTTLYLCYQFVEAEGDI